MKPRTYIYKVLGRNKIYIAIITAITALTSFMVVFYALFLKEIINAASNHDQELFFKNLTYFVCFILFNIALFAINRALGERAYSNIENSFKLRLFSVLLHSKLTDVTKVHSAKWMTRLTSDTSVVANNALDLVPGVVNLAVRFISALSVILVLEPRFVYLVAPSAVAMIIGSYICRKKIKDLHKKVQEADGNLRSTMQDHLNSMEVIYSYATQKQSLAQITLSALGYRNSRIRRNNFTNVCYTGLSIFMNGFYVVSLGICGHGILTGAMSYGTLMAVLHLVNQVRDPLASVTGIIPQYHTMIASAERLMEAENSETLRDLNKVSALNFTAVKNFYDQSFTSLKLQDAWFRYSDNGENVLQNKTLEIKKNSVVAFKGLSGCGKSTALKVLMGIYPLWKGKRLLCTTEGSMEDTEGAYQKLFAYVPQENLLMSGTIREVITFGSAKKMKDEDLLWNALDVACAKEFVQELDKGLDTVLGEKGSGLSEGQMQRLAIARAIVSGHPILMLDECTSALDGDTEKKLIENLKQLKNHTIVLITHRPAALEICTETVEF